MPRLAGKVAIVTGAGGDIGSEIAVVFAEEGAGVAVVDVNLEAAQKTVTKITEKGGRAIAIAADISQESDAQRITTTTVEQLGGLDILVNNAAIFVLKGLEATKAELMRSCEVNIVGTALVTKYAAEHMKAQRRGSIVIIGSMSGHIAQDSLMAYSMTKAAVMQQARNFAIELAPFNIRSNSVSPGTIFTSATAHHVATGTTSVEKEAAKHMLNRLGTTREVAYPVLFLASDEASFITGTDLMVDGGYVAW
eukprot:gnl/Hemi2/10375_TR3575_c0_g2_i1.p1 gnl/Hemi2/10375_TR3575_c0_g2~~gnl/Hemi2/10375_TR3575_c0_g2_i1.p1  ORF type:complete len:251 (-),score=79.76 gnl/Hemi2/10375_TR3575_c0_g2_i1:83-835(-)